MRRKRCSCACSIQHCSLSSQLFSCKCSTKNIWSDWNCHHWTLVEKVRFRAFNHHQVLTMVAWSLNRHRKNNRRLKVIIRGSMCLIWRTWLPNKLLKRSRYSTIKPNGFSIFSGYLWSCTSLKLSSFWHFYSASMRFVKFHSEIINLNTNCLINFKFSYFTGFSRSHYHNCSECDCCNITNQHTNNLQWIHFAHRWLFVHSENDLPDCVHWTTQIWC